MSLKDIQKDADRWTGQFDPQYWPPYEILARLIEEAGEIGREINHIYGTKKKKQDEPQNSLGQEICDLIFTVVCMANQHNIDLQEEWDKMMKEKHYGRDNDRFDKKDKK